MTLILNIQEVSNHMLEDLFSSSTGIEQTYYCNDAILALAIALNGTIQGSV